MSGYEMTLLCGCKIIIKKCSCKASIWIFFLTFARNKLVGMNKQNNISPLSANQCSIESLESSFPVSITVIQNDVTTVFIC